MTIRTAHASLAPRGTLAGRANFDASTESAARAAARIVGAALKDRRAVAGVTTEPAVAAAATRLPGSQSVFLSFRLDRTSIPYVAERG